MVRFKSFLLVLVSIVSIALVSTLLVKGVIEVYSKAAEIGEENNGQVGKYQAIIVTTPSMHPAMKVGSMSLVKLEDMQRIQIGDIVMYRNGNNENIVHRVIEISTLNGKLYFQTKGDDNKDPDGVLVDSNRYEGKVIVTLNWLAPLIKPFMGGTIVEYAVFKMVLVTVIAVLVLYNLIKQMIFFFRAVYYVFINNKSYEKYLAKVETIVSDCKELQEELNSNVNFESEGAFRKLRRSSHLAKMLDSIEEIKDNKKDMQKRIKKYNKCSKR